MEVSDKEELYKPIFTNVGKFEINNYSAKVASASSFLYASVKDKQISDKPYINNEILIEKKPTIRKYYYIKGSYYLFEPVLADKSIIISDSTLEKNIQKPFEHPGFLHMNYMYSYDEALISKLLSLLENLNYNSVSDIYNVLDIMEKEMNGYYSYVFNMTCCILDDLSLFHKGKDILRSMLLLSFLLQITRKPIYLNRYLEYSINSEVLFCENRYFLWNQAKRYMLINRACTDSHTSVLMKELYHKTFFEYAEQLKNELAPIPKKERNKDTIAVFTIQFLSERHAPTRTTLERCYTLAKPLQKKILLINTREQLTRKGMLLIYMPTLGNVIEEYNTMDYYQYKDCSIPYYQPGDNMPSVEEIKVILNKIRELKPSLIFSIGNGGITADLCGKLVPEASIGVAFSILPTTMATFSVIGKKLSDLEWENYIRDGYRRESIIESTFTFELIPKKKTFNREYFGIPVQSFVLVTVGIRLDMEIDDEFIETVCKTFIWGTHIVFAGYFDRYQYYCETYPDFREHSTFTGYCDDILALMEICNLYVNPKRLGGGFSIIEAFHEGKPGVTIDYGDIAIAAGKLFTVKNYDEMTEIISRYITDKKFYQLMAERAIAREKVLTDSAGAMNEIIHKIQDNPLFF
jgi:hypothetical protein